MTPCENAQRDRAVTYGLPRSVRMEPSATPRFSESTSISCTRWPAAMHAASFGGTAVPAHASPHACDWYREQAS